MVSEERGALKESNAAPATATGIAAIVVVSASSDRNLLIDELGR